MSFGASKRKVFKGRKRAPSLSLPEEVPASPSCAAIRAALKNEDENFRRCVASGERCAKEDMLRFVVGPDKSLVPDVTGKLPGRGLWLKADRAVLEQAFSKNPFSRAAKEKVVVAPDLLAFTEALLEKRVLETLGLVKRAGRLVAGQMQVEDAAKAHKLAFILVAADAGKDGLKKLAFSDIPKMRYLTSSALGTALGRDHLVYVGFYPDALTRKLKNELIRWQNIAFGVMKSEESESLEQEPSQGPDPQEARPHGSSSLSTSEESLNTLGNGKS